MATRASSSTYRVQVLDRTFSILTLIASSRSPLGPTEIGDRLKLNKSTAHRLLSVLEKNRFVEREYGGSRYRLGMKLIELGGIALSRIDLHTVAKPFVERLAADTGETAHLGILRQTEVISLVNAEGRHNVRTPSTVGRRSPMHCTSQGKALLAFQDSSLVDSLLKTYEFTRFTNRTVRSAPRLRMELAKVRRDGYAVDDEEYEKGLRCIGAPVRDHTGEVVAAISIAGPSFRISPERTAELSRRVAAAAQAISETLGYGASDPKAASAASA